MLALRGSTNSLAAKLFSVVFLVLLLNLGVLGYVNVRLHRKHLEATQLRAAERMSDVVRRSTTYSMLRNDRDALRHLVETIGAEPGITRLRITDHQGRVRYATQRQAGGRVINVRTPIENSPTCSSGACHAHPASQKILGMLSVDLSLAEADKDVRSASWQFLALSIGVIGLTLLATVVSVRQFVLKPDQALRDEALSLEQNVQSKTAELRLAHQQMIQAEKLTSLGKLAAVVAHEINNPLSGILTYAKLLRRWIERGDSLEQRSAEMRDSLQLIENESRRCGDIVRNLLTFARVQPLNVSEVDINRLVQQTMKLVEHKLELGSIVSELDLGQRLPSIHGDAGQIEQVLLAMVMNAIEAMPREGNLHISTASPDGMSILLKIEDDGIGIAPDILPHLFEPFTTTKEQGKGIGLGLAISRAIVDRHGGAIDVKSEAGVGTTFTITIPGGGQAILPVGGGQAILPVGGGQAILPVGTGEIACPPLSKEVA